MADGCIYENKVILALALKDKNHVEKFQKFLETSQPVKTYRNGYKTGNYYQAGLSIYSKTLTQKLAKYGVVPNKSKTAKVESLENNKHFWRGVIDGDGCIGISERKGFIDLVGSKNLVSQFLNYVNSFTPTKAKVRKNKSIFSVRFTGYIAESIIKNLYDGSQTYLERKKLKAIEVLKLYEERRIETQNRDSFSNQIIKAYESGKSGIEISKEFSINSRRVYSYLKKKGVSARPKTKEESATQRYIRLGLCKDCGSETKLNQKRCGFHLQKERERYHRNKANSKTQSNRVI